MTVYVDGLVLPHYHYVTRAYSYFIAFMLLVMFCGTVDFVECFEALLVICASRLFYFCLLFT